MTDLLYCFKRFGKCAQNGHQQERCSLYATRFISCWLTKLHILTYKAVLFKSYIQILYYWVHLYTVPSRLYSEDLYLGSTQECHINLWHIQERRRKMFVINIWVWVYVALHWDKYPVCFVPYWRNTLLNWNCTFKLSHLVQQY